MSSSSVCKQWPCFGGRVQKVTLIFVYHPHMCVYTGILYTYIVICIVYANIYTVHVHLLYVYPVSANYVALTTQISVNVLVFVF